MFAYRAKLLLPSLAQHLEVEVPAPEHLACVDARDAQVNVQLCKQAKGEGGSDQMQVYMQKAEGMKSDYPRPLIWSGATCVPFAEAG